MTPTEPVRAKSPDDELELDEYLREEYTFRHDLIRRLLFWVTAVAALVSIVPFTRATVKDLVRGEVLCQLA